jgi:beta-galactosidase
MKSKSFFGMALLTFFVFTSLKGLEFKEIKQSFDFDWKFYLGDNVDASKPEFNDLSWRTLDVPHDFSIEQAFNSKNPSLGGGAYTYGGIGWYRKHFLLDGTSKDKKIMVLFNGVYRNSEVWINGHNLGFRPYGYTSFYYDLTPYLNPVGKENIIAVRVNTTEQQNSRWYTGAGIYRHVYLISTGKVHFEQWGIFAQTLEATIQKAKINIAVSVFNEEKSKQKCEILSTLIDAEGKKFEC